MSINKKKKNLSFDSWNNVWFIAFHILCFVYIVYFDHFLFVSYFFFCYRRDTSGSVCWGGGGLLLLLMIGRIITRFYLLFECVDFLTITRNICWKPTTEYLLVWTKKSNSYFKFVVPFSVFFRRGGGCI